MKRIKNFKRLTETETQKMLDGCKDMDGFLDMAQNYYNDCNYIYSALESIKYGLKDMDVDSFILQCNQQFTDLVDSLIKDYLTSFDDLSQYLAEAEDDMAEMCDRSGYSEEDTKTLYHNCLYHGIVSD